MYLKVIGSVKISSGVLTEKEYSPVVCYGSASRAIKSVFMYALLPVVLFFQLPLIQSNRLLP